MTVVLHTRYMALRHLRNLARQPWYIGFTLAQPVIYLLLFGELFRSVADIPDFGAASYIAFLTPGIVIQTALFSAGWSGGSVIEDLDRGVMDRFLVSPASRVALIAGRLIQLCAVAVIQSLIIVGLGLLRGARFEGGVPGVVALIGCAVLLAAPFGALSVAMALTARRMESVIGAVNLLLLPLTFLSSVFMAEELMPGWIRAVARYNPVNWAVEAGREALRADANWALVFLRLGWLCLLGLACGWLATRAFRSYQRSV